MLKNYLKVGLRTLRKHAAYSMINVVGLAIGLTCFILIMLFVKDELRYDRHHEHADDTYRVVVDIQNANDLTQTAQSGPAWGPDMKHDFPEVVEFARMKPPNQKWMVGREDRAFYEKELAFVDSTVFDVFSIRFLRGDPETALDAPFKMVISESMAEKYFPGEDPIGRTITLDAQYDFEVTAIMADMPPTGHFHFGFLPSISTLARAPIYGSTQFLDTQFPQLYTYLLLRHGASPESLEAKFPDFVDKYIAAQIPLDDIGIKVKMSLQPLTSIHLHSHRENEIGANGDTATVYIFFAIGIFMLVIASINFMNLATARSASRAKEVGLRKAVGAQREDLIGQFVAESVLLGMLALIVAIIPVWLALPEFNAVTGKDLSIVALADPTTALILVGVTVLVGLLAGSYPAFFLSAFRPALVLKGELAGGSARGTLLRKGLIVFQFLISIVLIVSTGVVYRQLQYVRAKNLGFDKEHVLIVELTDPTPRTLYPTFRQMLERNPNVISMSASSSGPAGNLNEFQMQPVTAAPDENWSVKTYMTDYDFVETLGIDLLAGRTSSREFPIDSVNAIGGGRQIPNGQQVVSTAVINRAAAGAFGWNSPEQAIDKELKFPGNSNRVYRIVGVVEDFHSQSAHEQISPTMILYGDQQAYFYTFIRLRPGKLDQTIDGIRQAWSEILPNYAFEYTFLDEKFDRLYKADAAIGTLLGFFALLTILIACLGLFGLASFTAEQRTKEIGVRKTLGASIGSIILLLSREFTILVLAAFVVAGPVAVWLMSRWLDGFAYRMDITQAWWIVAAAGIAAWLIALATVSYQSIKAAMTNPVVALRYE